MYIWVEFCRGWVVNSLLRRKPKNTRQQATHIIMLLYSCGLLNSTSLIPFIIWIVIGRRILGDVIALSLRIPFMTWWSRGVRHLLNESWCPWATWRLRTPDKYTFIVEWDSFNDARWATNNRRVDSEVGTAFLVASLQNLKYWLIPELYVFHVDGADPSE